MEMELEERHRFQDAYYDDHEGDLRWVHSEHDSYSDHSLMEPSIQENETFENFATKPPGKPRGSKKLPRSAPSKQMAILENIPTRQPKPFLVITNSAPNATNERSKDIGLRSNTKLLPKTPVNTPGRILHSRSTAVNSASVSSSQWNSMVPNQFRHNSFIDNDASLNILVTSPFKQSQTSWKLSQTANQRSMSPSQELKESTIRATRALARQLAQQKPATPTIKSGKLLKGRLQPMNTFVEDGPVISHCIGIQPEPSENSAVHFAGSRTFQRRIRLLQQLSHGTLVLPELKDNKPMKQRKARPSLESNMETYPVLQDYIEKELDRSDEQRSVPSALMTDHLPPNGSIITYLTEPNPLDETGQDNGMEPVQLGFKTMSLQYEDDCEDSSPAVNESIYLENKPVSEGNTNNNSKYTQDTVQLGMPTFFDKSPVNLPHHRVYSRRPMSAHPIIQTWRHKTKADTTFSHTVLIGHNVEHELMNPLGPTKKPTEVTTVKMCRPKSAGPAEFKRLQMEREVALAHFRGNEKYSSELDLSIEAHNMSLDCKPYRSASAHVDNTLNIRRTKSTNHHLVEREVRYEPRHGAEGIALSNMLGSIRAMTCDVCGQVNYKVAPQCWADRRCDSCFLGDGSLAIENSGNDDYIKYMSKDETHADELEQLAASPVQVLNSKQFEELIGSSRRQLARQRQDLTEIGTAQFLRTLLAENGSNREDGPGSNELSSVKDDTLLISGSLSKCIYKQAMALKMGRRLPKYRKIRQGNITRQFEELQVVGKMCDADGVNNKILVKNCERELKLPTEDMELLPTDRMDAVGRRRKLKVECSPKPLTDTRSTPLPKKPVAPYPPLCFPINALPANGQFFYFAYGMDMNAARLGAYIYKPQPDRFWSLLFGFQLKFNKKGIDKEAGGFPNIIFNETSSVEGIIYKLSVEDEVNLDKAMGFPEMVIKVVLPVWMLNHKNPDELGIAQWCVPAVTYIAKDDWITTGEEKLHSEYTVRQCLQAADVLSPAYKEYLIAQIN